MNTFHPWCLRNGHRARGLAQREAANTLSDMLLLQSPLLRDAGFDHGFTTRTGGVSEGPFASLNLGRALGDRSEAVAENHALLKAALGFETLYELSQVHSDLVFEAEGDEDPVVFRQQEGDALVSRRAGAAVGVRTADCVPILLAQSGGAVAAVHAGWRGVESNIVTRAVELLKQRGTGEILAAIGPHIHVDKFELGSEVAERLRAIGPEGCIDSSYAKPHADLAMIVRAQLEACDVAEIDEVRRCTFSEAENFFSYRRDGNPSGRQLSVILPK